MTTGNMQATSPLSPSLQNFFNQLPVLISYLDKAHALRFVSDSYKRYLTIEPHSLLGAHPWDILGREEYQKIARHEQAALAGEEQNFQTSLHLPGYGDVVFHIVYVPHTLDGETIGVFAYANDLSDAIETAAERELSENRFRAIVEDQSEIISRFKADGTLTYVNPMLCRFFGQRAEAILGTQWQPLVYEEDLAEVEEQIQKLCPDQPTITIENRVYNGAGEIRWLQFTNRGFFDSGGSLLEVQCVGRDITLLKQKEQLILESQAELAESAKQLEKVNTALEVLLERRNRQLAEVKNDLLHVFHTTTLPELLRLKSKLGNSRDQASVDTIIRNMQMLISHEDDPIASRKHNLTKTEIQVSSLIRDGMTTREIADHLCISVNTVGFHRKNIRRKCGILHAAVDLKEFLGGR